MNIALIGYGKMGQLIEQIALEKEGGEPPSVSSQRELKFDTAK